eukprot:scaffold97598_cov33-Tisochrysis_lutea.AAC.3
MGRRCRRVAAAGMAEPSGCSTHFSLLEEEAEDAARPDDQRDPSQEEDLRRMQESCSARGG